MDGTLIDSAGIWNKIIAELIKHHSGQEIDLQMLEKEREDFIENFGGANVYKAYSAFLVNKYKLDVSIENAWKTFKQSLPEMIDNLRFQPFSAEFLAKLKARGFKLALATNNVDAVFEALQKNKNMHINNASFDKIFDLIVSSGDVEYIKPAPDIYLLVLEKFKTSPEECLVFEDLLEGVRAAKAAGIEVVNAPNPRADKDRAEIDKLADYKFDSYKELLCLDLL